MSPNPSPRPRLAALVLTTALIGVGAPAAYASLERAEPAAGAAPVPAARTAASYVETRLHFGTARPDGGPAVTDRQFRAFLDEVVTPRFPAGLTVQEGHGQYRDARGTVERERSYELVLRYPASAAARNASRVEAVRATYRRWFGQEAVPRVDDRVRVDL